MRRFCTILCCIASASLLFTSNAYGHDLSARATADIPEQGAWSIGVFNPLRVALYDGMQLEIHPLIALAAPNAKLRVSHGQLGVFRISGEYALSLPTPAMLLLRGIAFPSWEMSERKVGWFIVPGASILASTGNSSVTTLRLAFSAGIPLGRNNARPLDSYAPLDLLLAPTLEGYRIRTGISHDYPLSQRILFRGGVDLWMVGKSPEPARNPLFVSARAGMDFGLGDSLRLALGAIWFNSDQRRTKLYVDEEGFSERRRTRTNDVFPMLDLIWERH